MISISKTPDVAGTPLAVELTPQGVSARVCAFPRLHGKPNSITRRFREEHLG